MSIVYWQGFFQGRQGEHLPPMALACPLLFACQLIQVFSFRYILLWLVFSYLRKYALNLTLLMIVVV